MANSTSWLPDIQKLINGIQSSIKNKFGSKYVYIKGDNLKKIPKWYDEEVKSLKETIFAHYPEIDGEDKYFIDHHKICALYMKSILVHDIIGFDWEKYEKDRNHELPILGVRLVKEFACFIIMKSIIEAWNKHTLCKSVKLKVPKQYPENFYKLIYLYSNRPDDFPTLSIAHIVYLLETMNLCQFHGKTSDFFKLPQ